MNSIEHPDPDAEDDTGPGISDGPFGPQRGVYLLNRGSKDRARDNRARKKEIALRIKSAFERKRRRKARKRNR